VVSNGGTVQWTDTSEPYGEYGGETSTSQSQFFPLNDVVQFEAYPANYSVYFAYWNVTGGETLSSNNNPWDITAATNFTVTAVFGQMNLGSNNTAVTVTSTSGGIIQWTDTDLPYGEYGGETTSTINNLDVTFPNNGNISFTGTPNANFIFLFFTITTGTEITNYTINPLLVEASSPFNLTAYFAPLTTTPTPSYLKINYFGWFESTVALAIYTITLMLALVFGTGYLGYKLMKQFGALIGINIGVILGFWIPMYWGFTFLPLWGVVTVIIVDAIYLVTKGLK
jgi:hypothetical protein